MLIIIPKLAEIYHEYDGDMPSVEEEMREQINELLDEVFNNYESDKLENLFKRINLKNKGDFSLQPLSKKLFALNLYVCAF